MSCVSMMATTNPCDGSESPTGRASFARQPDPGARDHRTRGQGLLSIMSTAFFGILILSLHSNPIHAQSVSCEAILEGAYDKSQGLQVWEQFPRIGILMGDPRRSLLMEHGIPLAVTMWRFLNDIDTKQNFESTPHFAIRVNPIESVDDLWGSKAFYAPISKITSASAAPAEIDRAAREYLQKRIDSAAAFITSYNLSIKEEGKDLRVAFISPVTTNIHSEALPLDLLAASFFAVFTNMRIEDSQLARQEFAGEYGAGCLQNSTRKCVIFSLGREIYRHALDLKNKARADVTADLCGYLCKR